MSFGIKIDVSAVKGLPERLSSMSDDEFNRIAIDAVNAATEKVYDLAVPRLNKIINLTDAYVHERMRVIHASTKPEARIIATGEKRYMTQLMRYGARQETQLVKHPKRSKGTPALGIPAGQKSGGMTVEVARGSRKWMPGGFQMKLRNNNGYGLFTRTGKGKKDYKIHYGPSVYQLFKVTARGVLDEAGDILEAQLLEKVDDFLTHALKDAV